MFYSVDILNPRNGKFGSIWLAAHGQLTVEEGVSKKKKTKLRKILQVDLSLSCKEILNYLRGAVPADTSGTDRPRLSLYLSAMLTYGATYIFNRQVKALLDEILSPRSVRCPPFQPAGEINCKTKFKPGQLTIKDVTTGSEDKQLGFGQVADDSTLDASGPRGPGFQVAEKADGSSNISAQLTGEALIDWLLSDDALPEIGDIVFPVENTVAEAMITLKEVDPIPPMSNLEDGFGDIQELVDISVALPELQESVLEPENQNLDASNLEAVAAPTGSDVAGLRRSHSPDLEPRKRAKQDEEPEATVDPAAIPTAEVEPMETAAPQETLEAAPEEELVVPRVPEAANAYDVDPEPVAPERPQMELGPLNQELLPVPKKRGTKKKSRLIIDKNIMLSREVLTDWRSNFQSTMRVTVPSDDYALNLHEGTTNYLMTHPGRKLQSSQLRELFTRNLVTRPQLNETFDEIQLQETEPLPMETPAIELPVPAIQVEEQIIPETESAFAADKGDHQPMAVEEAPVPTTDVQMAPVEPAAEGDLPTEGFLDAADMLQTSVARKRASSVCGSIASISNTPRVSNVNDIPPAARLLPSATLDVLREVSAELRASAAMSSKGAPSQFNVSPLAVHDEILEEPTNAIQKENTEVDNLSDVPAPCDLPQRQRAAASPPRGKKVPVPAGDELLAMIRLYFLDNGLDSQDRITFKQLAPPTRFIRVEAAKLFVNLLDLMKKGLIDLDQPDSDGDIFIRLDRP